MAFGSKEMERAYEAGKKLGSQGKAPPRDLNKVMREIKVNKTVGLKRKGIFFEELEKVRKEIDAYRNNSQERFDLDSLVSDLGSFTSVDPVKEIYREGYIEGVRQFNQVKGISIDETGILIRPESVKDEEWLGGFIPGINLEWPDDFEDGGITMEREIRTEKGLAKVLGSPTLKLGSIQEHNKGEGRKAGFIIGVVRDYGEVLKEDQVPMDKASYLAWDKGRKGETLGRKLSQKKRIPETKEGIEEHIYCGGIYLWLVSQRIKTTVKPRDICDEESLEAFKAALRGERISKYEREMQELVVNWEMNEGNIRHSPGLRAYTLGKIERRIKENYS